MPKQHSNQINKQKLYSLVESLNAGGLTGEIYKINNNSIKTQTDPAEYIVNLAISQMQYIEHINLQGRQNCFNQGNQNCFNEVSPFNQKMY